MRKLFLLNKIEGKQKAKKAGFAVIKASKDAETMVDLARGEAECSIKQNLIPKIIRKQAIEK